MKFGWVWRWLASRQPKQLALPLTCAQYGKDCEYTHELCWDGHGFSYPGFYGRCIHCGAEYDPGCDR